MYFNFLIRLGCCFLCVIKIDGSTSGAIISILLYSHGLAYKNYFKEIFIISIYSIIFKQGITSFYSSTSRRFHGSSSILWNPFENMRSREVGTSRCHHKIVKSHAVPHFLLVEVHASMYRNTSYHMAIHILIEESWFVAFIKFFTVHRTSWNMLTVFVQWLLILLKV